MKYFAIVLSVSICFLAACKEEKKSTDIITQKPMVVKKTEPVTMEAINNAEAVKWLGKTYTVEIHRYSDKELPKTRDEYGVEYFDNHIEVKVLRPDGTEFFGRVFNKQSFHEYLDEATIKDGAMLAFRFTEVKNDCLVFVASVGSPDAMSDDYIPLIVTISRMGEINIKRDNRIDEIPGAEESAEERDTDYDESF